MVSSICLRLSSKSGGAQSSSLRLYRRTASIPCASRSSSISDTIRAVSGSLSKSRWPPCLNMRTVFLLSFVHLEGSAKRKGVHIPFSIEILSLSRETVKRGCSGDQADRPVSEWSITNKWSQDRNTNRPKRITEYIMRRFAVAAVIIEHLGHVSPIGLGATVRWQVVEDLLGSSEFGSFVASGLICAYPRNHS